MPTIQQIREVIVRGKAEGLDRVASDLRKVAGAQDNVAASSQAVATVTDMTTKRQISAASAWERMRKSVDDEYRALKAVEKAQRDADRAVAQGVATQEQAASVVAAVATKFGLATDAAAALSMELGRAAAAQAALEARADAYLASLSPVHAAQKRFNVAVNEAEDLYTAGAISLANYEAGLARARSTMDAATASARKLAEVQAEQAQASINGLLGVRDDFDTTRRAADIEAFAGVYANYTRGLLEARDAELALAAARARASQTSLNDRLGVRDDFGTAARARDIEAFAREYDQYVRKLVEARQAEEALARARAQSAQANVNSVLGVRDDFGTASRAADIAAVGREIDRLRGKYVPLYAMQQGYKASLVEINEAARQGVLSETERAAAIQRTKDAFAQQVQIARSDVFAGVAKGAKLSAFEVTNLSYQLNDVVTMLASGSSPFQVIATQGGQVFQILQGSSGGVVGGLKSLGSTLAGLVTPARAVAGGFAGIGIAAALAYSDFAATQERLASSLDGLGRMSGLTVKALRDVAEQSADAGRITAAAATELAATYAETGKIGRDQLGGLITITAAYAKVTQQDVGTAGKELAAAFANPAKGAEELDKKLNFLSLEALQAVRRLDSLNERAAVQDVILKALRDDLPDVTARLTAMGHAWDFVAKSAANAWTQMQKKLGGIFVETIEDRIARLRSEIEANEKALARGGGYGFSTRATNQRLIQEKTDLVLAILAQGEAADVAAKKTEELNKKTAEGYVRERDPRIDELNSLTKQAIMLREAIDKGGPNAGMFADTLSGVENRIKSITGANKELISVSEDLRRESELKFAIDKAAPGLEKQRAIAAMERYRAEKEGASEATVEARVQAATLEEQVRLEVQLREAKRQRSLAAAEAKAQQELEVQLIGKTAAEQAELRANFQSYWELRKEAEANGTGFDERQLALLKEKNKETARSAQLAAEAKLRSDIQFERDQLGRTEGDRQIASAQRSAGLEVNLNNSTAAAMRLNQQLATTSDLASSALSGFAQDLLNGTSAADALNNMLKRIASQLIEMAARQLVAQALGGLAGGAGGYSGGQAVMTFGGNGPYAVPTFHTGGLIGAEQPGSRIVHPAYFENAPRFHTGGFIGPGEVPLIAKQGEAVLTAGQMRALGLEISSARQAASERAGSTFVNVQNYGQDRAQVRESRRGNDRFIDVIVAERVNKVIATGQADQSMQGRYATLPRKVVRG